MLRYRIKPKTTKPYQTIKTKPKDTDSVFKNQANPQINGIVALADHFSGHFRPLCGL